MIPNKTFQTRLRLCLRLRLLPKVELSIDQPHLQVQQQIFASADAIGSAAGEGNAVTCLKYF